MIDMDNDIELIDYEGLKNLKGEELSILHRDETAFLGRLRYIERENLFLLEDPEGNVEEVSDTNIIRKGEESYRVELKTIVDTPAIEERELNDPEKLLGQKLWYVGDDTGIPCYGFVKKDGNGVYIDDNNRGKVYIRNGEGTIIRSNEGLDIKFKIRKQ